MTNPRDCACAVEPNPPCRPCVVYRDDPATRAHVDKLVAANPGSSPPGVIPLECVHLGDTVRGDKAPDLLRDWRECGRGRGAVCRCMGCGPACPDYLPDEE